MQRLCDLFSANYEFLVQKFEKLRVVWEGSRMVVIDQLGAEFLETVRTGDVIEVTEEGTVRIL